jgi:2-polyprenyl-3-methyl-5-hydroxy-6-metoxy-1,4-benzoquinol methylase
MTYKQFYNEDYFKQLIKNKSLYQFLAVKLIPIIKPIAKEKPVVKILEIGCGKGNFVSYLFEKDFLSYGKFRVYLSDIVHQEIKYPFIENFEIINAEEKIPYYNEFDLILALDVIEHIGNFKSFITNVHNSLNKDGIFFLLHQT